jgi:hypothetical protein
MATYRQIQVWVRSKYRFVPQTCWIAHVLSDHGLTTRVAPNRADAAKRDKPCPPNKRPAIEDALRYFKMV